MCVGAHVLSGNLKTWERVSIRGWRTKFTVQTFRGFVLSALFEDGKPAGKFEVSTGCVILRASVIESKYVWYSEEDGYQKVVPVDDPNMECCACDQAKYELEFIGLWSKETHPKDFPTLEHLTHFTDMLGASHSRNYSLWEIGGISTDGMKEIAEWGNTFKAEAEAKEKILKHLTQNALLAHGSRGANVRLLADMARGRGLAFLNPKQQESECNVDLIRKDICVGESGDDCSVTPDPLCKTTSWSEWSPCSASCDDGVRVRTRLFFFAEHEQRCSHITLQEKDSCILQSCRRFIEQNSEEICQEPKEEGQCGGTFPRYWYNHEKQKCERFVYTGCKGNRNQFETEDECKRVCVPGYEIEKSSGDPVPCEMNEWTPWGQCSVTCGRGKKTRTRQIKTFPRNGGTPCPEHLIQELRCELRPCPSTKCRAGSWSRWSRCSVTCGEGVQTRRRRVQKGRNGDWEEEECKEKETEERICPNRTQLAARRGISPLHALTALRQLVDHPLLIEDVLAKLAAPEEIMKQLASASSGKMAALGQLLNECGIGVAVENEDPEDEDPLSSIPVEMPHPALIFCQWKSSVQLVSGALSR
ncbi:thrombospondin type 1 domain protein [Ancylostoma ceylanicum]|uniref:Thrombospondin type 1 domain protein n=1 Tax=Ancylostoma ceylanicum TaxID=53326 RepID=A0A0D6LE56_9BILA|nr:thrombospondin type 1 domain protein [Ancylostoma ceylanicum]